MRGYSRAGGRQVSGRESCKIQWVDEKGQARVHQSVPRHDEPGVRKAHGACRLHVRAEGAAVLPALFPSGDATQGLLPSHR